MPTFKIEWHPAALRALRKLDPPVARRLAAAVSGLAEDPRPQQSKPLTGEPGLTRLRVGDYRIVYEVHDGELRILVVTLGHRSSIYRAL